MNSFKFKDELEYNNNTYLQAYMNVKLAENKPITSIHQYTSRARQLAKYLNKDMLDIHLADLQFWLRQENNSIKIHYIVNFYKVLLIENVNDFQSKIHRDFLLFLAMN
jgi:predicted RecB family endonuclease